MSTTSVIVMVASVFQRFVHNFLSCMLFPCAIPLFACGPCLQSHRKQCHRGTAPQAVVQAVKANALAAATHLTTQYLRVLQKHLSGAGTLCGALGLQRHRNCVSVSQRCCTADSNASCARQRLGCCNKLHTQVPAG